MAFLLFQVAHAQTVRYKAHAWLCHLLAAQPCTFEPKCLICDIILITNDCFRKCRKCSKGLKDQVSKPQSAALTASMTSLLLPSLYWTCCVLWVFCHWGNKWSKEKNNLCWLSAVSITTQGSVEYGLFDFSALVVIRLKARGQLIWLLSWRLEERICLKAHWGMFSGFLCWEQLKCVLEVCVDSTLIVICTVNPLKIWFHTFLCLLCAGAVSHLCALFDLCAGGCSGGRAPLFSNISIPWHPCSVQHWLSLL